MYDESVNHYTILITFYITSMAGQHCCLKARRSVFKCVEFAIKPSSLHGCLSLFFLLNLQQGEMWGAKH